MKLLALRLVEHPDEPQHRRRGDREDLPQLLTRLGVDPERAVFEIELEVFAEHVFDMVLSAPLGRLSPVQRLIGEAAVELAELRVRFPRRETKPSTGTRDTRELRGDAHMVGRPDETECRRDDAECIRVEWEILAIPGVAGHRATGAAHTEFDPRQPGREVEPALALPWHQALDELLCHRLKRACEAIVRDLVPSLCHVREHTCATMPDLFDEAAGRRLEEAAPLAQRLRPRTLDDFVGQEHVVGPGRALRLAIEADRVPSLVLFGPPGSGKTTLARIVANTTGAEFKELSAVSATVAQVREVLADARERLGATGRRTILFLDEIHRFNKAQQDALLPGVEEGLLTLIGATTENPYFELNSALLSRTQLYELESLSEDDLREVVRRGTAELATNVSAELEQLIARRAGGDARTALAILELAVHTAKGKVEEQHVEDAARKRPLVYDKTGDAHHDFISAWIKSTRAGDVQASIYYLAVMLEGGEDPRFIARRMIVLASEDIGNADPQALLIAVAAAQAVEHVGLPEARLNLAQAAIYLAGAPKSNASYTALKAAAADVREHGHLRPPDALRSAAYPGAAKLGRGKGYVYPHDDPAGFGVDCLPDELKGCVYYEA